MQQGEERRGEKRRGEERRGEERRGEKRREEERREEKRREEKRRGEKWTHPDGGKEKCEGGEGEGGVPPSFPSYAVWLRFKTSQGGREGGLKGREIGRAH